MVEAIWLPPSGRGSEGRSLASMRLASGPSERLWLTPLVLWLTESDRFLGKPV